MTIPKSYEALAADLASEKILSKTLLGQKEAYMMLADQCKIDLDEAMARNSALERKNANQCETIREYQDIEAALLEELELQKNHFKIQLQGAKDADMLQQRLTVAERDARRYRYLREGAVMHYMSAEGSESKDEYLTITGYGHDDSAESIDNAIDAQMLAALKPDAEGE